MNGTIKTVKKIIEKDKEIHEKYKEYLSNHLQLQHKKIKLAFNELDFYNDKLCMIGNALKYNEYRDERLCFYIDLKKELFTDRLIPNLKEYHFNNIECLNP